jgi:beta-N-acetylhexosaminidase
VSTIDRLHQADDVELVALFGPEHGIRGRVEGGERVADDIDPATGAPIYSLYGETRKPTPAMLEGLDLLLFDIQDIGARYYTYVWTMALAMEAAGEAGVVFVVLDRPNPIGGRLVQGNVLDPEYATFVGLYPVPMRHGLTVGELARLLAGHFGIAVDLRVIPMEGWTRTTWYDATGLPFTPPSPNMPSLASATHYPGTCLFEGTNLSVGRGTDLAFQQIGAPWLDAEAVVDTLNAAGLEGVRFEAVSFVPEAPGDRKYDGEMVQGVRFVATDREHYDPTHAAIAALTAIYARHPDQVEWYVAHFDRLAGTDGVRTAILAGDPFEAIVASWEVQTEDFENLRRPYFLYR